MSRDDAAPPPRSPSRRSLLLYGGVGAGFAAVGALAGWFRLRPDPTAGQEVELLFGQTLPDAAGRPFELASLRGRPLVVNFWATWCAPCVEEMPELSALHTEVSPRGIHVVGIGIDSPANIAQFAQKLPVSYPLLVAGLQGTELARRFGNSAGALPYTVLVDAQGRVVFRKLGRIRLDQLRAHALAMAR